MNQTQPETKPPDSRGYRKGPTGLLAILNNDEWVFVERLTQNRNVHNLPGWAARVRHVPAIYCRLLFIVDVCLGVRVDFLSSMFAGVF